MRARMHARRAPHLFAVATIGITARHERAGTLRASVTL